MREKLKFTSDCNKGPTVGLKKRFENGDLLLRFLDNQGHYPRKTQKPLTSLLVSKHEAQSESTKALSLRSVFVG